MPPKIVYMPCTFLDVVDLNGGRKTVLVANDGQTFIDACNNDAITPVAIHPLNEPLELKTLMQFARENDLMDALRTLCGLIDARQEGRSQRDALFVMRALRAYACGPRQGVAQDYEQALASADQEEQNALEEHRIYERVLHLQSLTQ